MKCKRLNEVIELLQPAWQNRHQIHRYRLFYCGIDPANVSVSRVRSITMKCKRLNEVIELLQPAWQKEPDLNLLQFLQKLAKESGFDGELADLTDDILIYHLKMRDSAKDAVIPGLQKDYAF